FQLLPFLELIPKVDSYRTVYILVDLPDASIEWVYVGEVRFLNSSGIPPIFSSYGMETTASPSSIQTSVTSMTPLTPPPCESPAVD
ncbi:hypothetical protein GBAR_LOCUS28120, partial [Geodia barretti]